jgi:hypothetical protein
VQSISFRVSIVAARHCRAPTVKSNFVKQQNARPIPKGGGCTVYGKSRKLFKTLKPFNPLRPFKQFCHSEQSEESLFDFSAAQKEREILRFAQNDKNI